MATGLGRSGPISRARLARSHRRGSIAAERELIPLSHCWVHCYQPRFGCDARQGIAIWPYEA
jgi:hypothetical protein